MELKQLQYFQVCAEQNSLTRAAEILYTTQPNVSMAIRALEKDLGVKLFIRKSKGVELTECGRRIYDYAINVLKNVNLISESGRMSDQITFSIATNPSSNMAVLFSQFYQKINSSGIHFRYTECGAEQMIEMLHDRKYELGFVFVAENKRRALSQILERKHLEFIPLVMTDMVLYVGKENPLYGRTSILPQELLSLPFAQLEEDYFTINDMLESLMPNQVNGNMLERVMVTNSNHVMIQMLKHTNLCNLGSYWLRDVYRQYDFQRITISGFEEKVMFGYLKARMEPLTPMGKDLLSFVEKALNEENVNLT
ncbi:LysR family transcriptional regulator [Alkalibaculum sp. M08DMB]|uniref:LysR family transcriptional regulator n=1 Tax=Alkalibaculum sporogenes TaxID=2655001 RepID=A0A6A7K9N4_9FIRM|nr:LysR family transcriptional regulator [Alkalibaculum sporogenes]MPW26170.1 LysR family transcriptional regulator [Alkalibaculum sporogenes]